MYELVARFNAIDEETGEAIEIEHHQETLVNEFDTATVTIHNNVYITSRSEMVYPVPNEADYYYSKSQEPYKYFRVIKS